MIETWGFYFLPPQKLAPVAELTPEDIQGAYDRYVDLWVNCERWGFDGLAWPEHHFSPILSPSPHLLVATRGEPPPRHDPRAGDARRQAVCRGVWHAQLPHARSL